jgi:hypothetical protein
VSSHFACIGFPIREIAEYERLKERAAAQGARTPLPGGGALVRWEVGGGPEIWTMVDAAGDVVDATPFHHVPAPLRLALTASGEDAEQEGQGWVEGWVEPVEPDEPISGAFPLRLDVVNYALVRDRLRTGAVLPMEICTIASEAALSPDAAAYERTRTSQYRPPLRSVVSAAHFGADLPEIEPEATALITGILTEARRLTNRITEASYWLLAAAGEKVTLSILADRETLPADPAPGNVLSASCWVLARVLDEVA